MRSVIILNVIMLSVVMLSVVMLNAIMLNVVNLSVDMLSVVILRVGVASPQNASDFPRTCATKFFRNKRSSLLPPPVSDEEIFTILKTVRSCSSVAISLSSLNSTL
jgi:hypothetical protein